jgi:two-component system LytT family response regulator
MYDYIKYLIVDDDELDRLTVLNEASKYPFLHKIGMCSNGNEAIETINKHRPDIVFSDIEMRGTSGIDIIRTLFGKIPAPVFITSHPEFALESYDLEIFDYILKPLSPERFQKCISRIQDFFSLRKKVMDIDSRNSDNSGYIMVKQGYEKHRLHHSDIIFLEAMKDYTKIKTLSGQSLLVLETLSSLLKQLPENKFVRVHRSYAVNIAKVECVSSSKVSLQGLEIPVGKSYKNAMNAWNEGAM